MEKSTALKNLVREKYSAIAHQSQEHNATSCCGAGSCGTGTYTIMSEDYAHIKGYHADADLGRAVAFLRNSQRSNRETQ